jgi:excinuclease ABC subunit C
MDLPLDLKNLPEQPGVYRYLDAGGQILYVGKAKNLKKRVASYFQKEHDSAKTRALVAKIAQIEITLTATDVEALILEANLIKQHKPRYNVLFRDDKSYPYLHLSADDFPRLSFHRGAQKKKGRYFGPYPNTGAVYQTLATLKKIFPVRQCDNIFFAHRTRPCLQYQIKRCSAPCVGLISAQDYAQEVKQTVLFLEGKDKQVIEGLTQAMLLASDVLDFERAAGLRDQIQMLNKIQEKQIVNTESSKDLDCLALRTQHGLACVAVMFIRNGHQMGTKAFFLKNYQDESAQELLETFLLQYYTEHRPPPEILLEALPEDPQALTQALAQQHGVKTQMRQPKAGLLKEWLERTAINAIEALGRQLAQKNQDAERMASLAFALGLEVLPLRMECFDISHALGEETKASCVVFEAGAPLSADYRLMSIKGVTAGDDYGAMHQALSRRLTRMAQGAEKQPDILLVDGGKGQYNIAKTLLAQFQLNDIILIGVAKGEGRKVGLEKLIYQDAEVFLDPSSPAMHLITHIRDEAHRFAITGHRKKRAAKRAQGLLDEIPGIGPKLRQRLLLQFGSVAAIRVAQLEDLMRVPGISQKLAHTLHDHFHAEP